MPSATGCFSPYFGMHRFEWGDGVEFQLPHGEWIRLLRANGFEIEQLIEVQAPETRESTSAVRLREPGLGAAVAGRGDLGRPEAMIVLASTSPQRRAILTQLEIPFEVVAPDYDEEPGGDPVEHAVGKARSVDGGDRPVLGVDTVVVCNGEQLGKPADEADARRMLALLSGRDPRGRLRALPARAGLGGDGAGDDARHLPEALGPGDLDRYLASGEWEGRAGGYAIQGLGASLVGRIEGDYLNVVGLPGRAARRPPRRRGSPAPTDSAERRYVVRGRPCDLTRVC